MSEIRLASAELDRAIDALVAEVERGAPEATHVLPFPRAQGFDVAGDLQAGDVFQRAVLLDVLADIHQADLRDLGPLITREADYLLARRRSYAPGGWSYFPDLDELPVDVDDLAQCTRALVAAGRRSDAAAAAAEPLAVLLAEGRNASGGYETWIVPSDSDDPRHIRQRWWIDHGWGRGTDGEVIANLALALTLLDAEAYSTPIAECRVCIAEHQGSDGCWPSSWYHGPFYPGWICAAALGAQSDQAQRWRAVLTRTQRPDGGWGWHDGSDALSTALAMLALGHRDPAVKAAQRYMRNTQEPDGMWPGSLWIRMELGRAQGQVHTVLSYGSRTIGTAFAIKALLRQEED